MWKHEQIRLEGEKLRLKDCERDSVSAFACPTTADSGGVAIDQILQFPEIHQCHSDYHLGKTWIP